MTQSDTKPAESTHNASRHMRHASDEPHGPTSGGGPAGDERVGSAQLEYDAPGELANVALDTEKQGGPRATPANERQAHAASKKSIPLYIGLATGFCGSFTSFSAFVRDLFLATSNDLTYPGAEDASLDRHSGYSFMAVVAVLVATLSLSIGGLHVGAHLAVALEPITPPLPYLVMRKLLDRLAVVLGWGCWLGAVLLCVWPPDRDGDGPETWRGRATFSLVFAPLGCLTRFYASSYLNGRMASFPLGTFAVNVGGTAVLGMAWNLAHGGEGAVMGCQVLQGIEDGFCGCLTTVSTWVVELTALRRRHAYLYGASSVLVAYALMVVVLGSARWTLWLDGFPSLTCVH
ncbi:hypothetical protein P8C59_000692 [Phyllachora maydis]|uniref:CrcB-like protein n=1 Tax=Phyllachora maydis TaxID=1825666 RepID=A0AAD9M6T4_9PEZI|nr:hypothetical protein P8C59_000692 [Phyllachora maydis]